MSVWLRAVISSAAACAAVAFDGVIERAVPHGRQPGNRDPGAWQKAPGSVNTAWAQLEPEFTELCRDYPKLAKTNHVQHLGTLGSGVRLSELRLQRPRQWGACWLALQLWQQL